MWIHSLRREKNKNGISLYWNFAYARFSLKLISLPDIFSLAFLFHRALLHLFCTLIILCFKTNQVYYSPFTERRYYVRGTGIPFWIGYCTVQ